MQQQASSTVSKTQSLVLMKNMVASCFCFIEININKIIFLFITLHVLLHTLIRSLPLLIIKLNAQLRISVSSICYHREIFPSDCFVKREYGSDKMPTNIHTLEVASEGDDGVINVNNTEAFLLTQWLERGVFRALEDQWLSCMTFAIYTKHPTTGRFNYFFFLPLTLHHHHHHRHPSSLINVTVFFPFQKTTIICLRRTTSKLHTRMQRQTLAP